MNGFSFRGGLSLPLNSFTRRHRVLRIKDLNAALSKSEKLTRQLTIQQAELGRANRSENE